jgi:hypothetical protein
MNAAESAVVVRARLRSLSRRAEQMEATIGIMNGQVKRQREEIRVALEILDGPPVIPQGAAGQVNRATG